MFSSDQIMLLASVINKLNIHFTISKQSVWYILIDLVLPLFQVWQMHTLLDVENPYLYLIFKYGPAVVSLLVYVYFTVELTVN